MANRLDLHRELSEIPGVLKVYFNPPESVKMNYPCIRYKLGGIDQKFADNITFFNTKKYEVTVIDPNPDSAIYEEIIKHFRMCRLDRFYMASNLYHFVITLYY